MLEKTKDASPDSSRLTLRVGELERAIARASSANSANDCLSYLVRTFEQAPGFICMLAGPAHVFVMANAAYRRIVGQRNIIGLPVREALPDIDGQGFYERLDEAYRSGTPVVGRAVAAEFAHAGDEGCEKRLLDFVNQPIFDENGQISGIFVEGYDVTERETAIASLRRSIAFNRSIIESCNDCTMVLDLEGRIIYRNDVCRRVVEEHDSPILTEAPWANMWGGSGAAATALAAARAGQTARFQAVSVIGGSQRWWDVQLSLIVGADHEPDKILSVARDVTAIKQAEEELRSFAGRLENEVEHLTREWELAWKHSRDLQSVVNDDGIIVAANDAWTSILGWPVGEVVGRSHRSFVHPDHPSEIASRLVCGRPHEAMCLHKDGSPRWISWLNAAGQGVTYGSGRDITAEKEQAEALRLAEQSLRQAQRMEAVGQLTGGLAHDFNNLLTGLLGNLEILRARLARGELEDLNRYLLAAEGAGRRAGSLTQRLLAFSRGQQPERRPIDVNWLIEDLREILRITLGTSIKLAVTSEVALWSVNTDRGQLENAMLNLSINGRDAMPNGGELHIRTANRIVDDRTARERDVPPGAYVSICVSDTGLGMDEQTIKRAFEPFFTTKPLGAGTGLGLSMVFGFARQSGGHVEIRSQIARGTTICIYLPRHSGSLDEVDKRAVATPQVHQSGKAVLVVEDEPIIRGLITEKLADLGYRVAAADDGIAGLAAVENGASIDLLITDVGLPNGLDGRQFADKARARRPGLKILFITGFADSDATSDLSLETGMDVLRKPFTVAAFATKVAEMMR
ncbi:PAS domain-containing protein [Sphingomonas sp. BIUV-7]|uniref:histidine kinase n=1 Tax=Sphingomonas natans TaxID=3063330 RepID=A0ABT8YE27_9SPHN|nr:PAS domain-containing protein [Sphingomonas sp. BIUV-7]MDO6416038.1 PAS domain-containing protein [Sphingomonas sp. BIUV-7]